MKYTIITACLNSELTIERTISSVLIQKYYPVEHIFVDGGSSDNTLKIIEDFSRRYKDKGIKIKIINQMSSGGIYEAWNMALSQIMGNVELIFILNSDDWYAQDSIEFIIEKFKKNGDIDIICGKEKRYENDSLKNSNTGKNKLLWLFPILMPIVHPACFIRKEVYDIVGNFNTCYRVSGDYDFLYRCYKANLNIKYFNKILINRLMGGYADKHKKLARKETLDISKKHSGLSLIPSFAFLVRKILKR